MLCCAVLFPCQPPRGEALCVEPPCSSPACPACWWHISISRCTFATLAAGIAPPLDVYSRYTYPPSSLSGCLERSSPPSPSSIPLPLLSPTLAPFSPLSIPLLHLHDYNTWVRKRSLFRLDSLHIYTQSDVLITLESAFCRHHGAHHTLQRGSRDIRSARYWRYR